MIARHRKLLAHTLLALALLIAQLAVQAHAFSHLRTPGDAGKAPVSQSQPCADCLAGSPLLAAASTPDVAFTFLAAPLARIDGQRFVSLIDQTPRHAFRSRAPPVLV